MVALAAGSACTHVQAPAPQQPAGAGQNFGRAGYAYDRSQWRLHTNADGRTLLAHNTVAKCFVDAEPSQDFVQPGFSLKRETKTIGGTRYEVVHVFEKQQFSEAVYLRAGSAAPSLGVYSGGRCQEEAERLLLAYEKTARK